MHLVRTVGLAAALAVTSMAGATVASADGALAVGRCDRHGYTYGYSSMGQARKAALGYCAENGDNSCEIVITISGNCAAFAVSGGCGPRGWASAPTRGRAEALAIGYCQQYGGNNCTIRRWVCDGG